jgi:hypothetical protein
VAFGNIARVLSPGKIDPVRTGRQTIDSAVQSKKATPGIVFSSNFVSLPVNIQSQQRAMHGAVILESISAVSG